MPATANPKMSELCNLFQKLCNNLAAAGLYFYYYNFLQRLKL